MVLVTPFSTYANTITEKNANIEATVKKAMDIFQVPGVAVAIVKDNKVVMSKGFGVIEHGKKHQSYA